MKGLAKVNDLQPGYIVADSVYDREYDYLLVGEGVTLDERMIWRLKERCISEIRIVDTLITPQERAIEQSRSETASKLSAFVDDLYATEETICIEPLRKAMDGIINHLTTNNDIMVYLQRISVHDSNVLAHLVDVAIYATLVGLGCGLSREDIVVMGTGALLHDIGKLGIEKRLLAKPTALTDSEYEIVKEHPEFGYQQLKRVESLDERARRVSLEHHERLDGSGYPRSLKSKNIHFFSKVTAVCDVYDALVIERSYRSAYSPDQAAKILRSDPTIDQNIVETLLARLVLYPVGTKVRLSNGAIGMVIRAQTQATSGTLVQVMFTQHNGSYIRRRKFDVLEIRKGMDHNISIVEVIGNEEYAQICKA